MKTKVLTYEDILQIFRDYCPNAYITYSRPAPELGANTIAVYIRPDPRFIGCSQIATGYAFTVNEKGEPISIYQFDSMF